MKNPFRLSIFAVMFMLVLRSFAGDRNEGITPEASVRVIKTELISRPDGGCAVLAYAEMTRADGGLASEASNGGAPYDVAGVNRTDCLQINNVRALVLFKLTNGF